jgi:protein-S-isoprenylcysteine O-methyltransferase Ste14
VNRSEIVRAGALYFPLVMTCVVGLLRRRPAKLFAACLVSTLWTAASLVMVQKLNAAFGWWSFERGDVAFAGMPLELYLGWVIGWGVLPQIALQGMPVALSAVSMIALDVVGMPRLEPVVMLGPQWWTGEAVAVALVLIPSVLVAEWTLRGRHLRMRAWMQATIAGMICLVLIPELVFAVRPGAGWEPLLAEPGWWRQLACQGVFLLALPGVSAVMEFAERGGGTPIPFDAPVRLVTSGLYRYLANPMQVSCALVLLAWALILRNAWMLAAPLFAFLYGAGLAEWDEGEDLRARFGEVWEQYRSEVRNWVPRRRPFHAGPVARLYVAETCGPCSELRAWLERRKPVGMDFVAAETLPQGSIRRMRYEPGDGTERVEGVRAMARALEHLNLGWALAGAALRLPGVWQFVQLMMDASGLGERVVQQRAECGVSMAKE